MIKIYVTLDCINLTDFEKIILSVIKGELYTFYNERSEPYCNEPVKYHITVKPTDKVHLKGLTTFKIEGIECNTPKGLFDEVKRLITPFSHGFQMQGGFKDDFTTSITLQRFEMKREHLHYYKAYGI